MIRVGVANDHHGIEVKKKIIEYLRNKGIEYTNFGCDSDADKENIDYIDYAVKLCNSITHDNLDCGILICGTGIGMSIAANKIKGIRAAKVNNPREAALAKEHNMANVITLAEYVEDVEKVVEAYLNTENSKEERHIRRVKKLGELENVR